MNKSTLCLVVLLFSVSAKADDKVRPQPSEPPVFSSINSPTLRWRSCVNPALKACEVAVIRGVLEQGPSEVYVRLQAGTPIPSLWHSVSERGMMLKGSLRGTDGQGKPFSVEPGDYWYFPAGMIHGGVRCSDEGSCVLYEIYDGTIDFNI